MGLFWTQWPWRMVGMSLLVLVGLSLVLWVIPRTPTTAIPPPSVYDLPSSSQNWLFTCQPQVVTLSGSGLAGATTIPFTVPESDWAILQVGGAGFFPQYTPQAPEALQVLTADTTRIITTPLVLRGGPTTAQRAQIQPDQAMGYVFETTVTTGPLTVTLESSPHTRPEALVVYAAEARSESFSGVGATTLQYTWGGDGTPRFPPMADATLRLSLPQPLDRAQTLQGQIAVMDLDTDSRSAIVHAEAGGRSSQTTISQPNQGEHLNLVSFTLADVPAGTQEVTIRLESPDTPPGESQFQGHGDSVFLLGASVWHPCSEATATATPTATSTPEPSTTTTARPYPGPGGNATATPVASGTPTPVVQALSQCIFPLEVADVPHPTARATLDEFHFAEPTVVMTGRILGFSGWLTDSQNVLITRMIEREGVGDEVIEQVDLTRGTVYRFDERYRAHAPAVWLPESQTVAVAAKQDYDLPIRLRLSGGGRSQSETVVESLAHSHLAVHPDGSTLTFFGAEEPGQPLLLDTRQRPYQIHPLSASVLPNAGPAVPTNRIYQHNPLRGAWSPDGEYFVFSNTTGLYLAQRSSQQLCEIDWKAPTGELAEQQWVSNIGWSPSGRWIAMEAIRGWEVPVEYIDLRLLDTLTGNVQIINLDVSAVREFTWTPDGRYLTVLGRVTIGTPEHRAQLGLFLIDTTTGALRQILPAATLTAGPYHSTQGGIAWSPNGTHFLFNCSVWDGSRIAEDRLCRTTITDLP